ncbi:MAG: cytidine deaminase [Clostridia bacterium]|nr:cytidine deaminase [Clostridia bacterium]
MTNEDLITIAKNARKNAVATNTGYSVGAALITKSGTVYIGANIEEYSIIGLSNCAERVAIQNALSHGERDFSAIAIVGGKASSDEIDDTLVPCGVCLQYILDMCKDVDIITYVSGTIINKKLSEFLPYGFELDKQN